MVGPFEAVHQRAPGERAATRVGQHVGVGRRRRTGGAAQASPRPPPPTPAPAQRSHPRAGRPRSRPGARSGAAPGARTSPVGAAPASTGRRPRGGAGAAGARCPPRGSRSRPPASPGARPGHGHGHLTRRVVVHPHPVVRRAVQVPRQREQEPGDVRRAAGRANQGWRRCRPRSARGFW